jgi:hypothetical protein
MTDGRLLVGLALDRVDTTDPRSVSDLARSAEGFGFNFLLFGDGAGAPGAPAGARGLDPLETASFASAVTRSIGLIAEAATTYAEPYHLSNRFSSLDWGSSGRAGWLATVDSSPARAAAYSASVPGQDLAHREADIVVDAVRRLWDSWEDEALVADWESGRFLDGDRLHYVDAGAELFSIRGPALMPRPVQGQVVVLARAGDGIAAPDVTIVAEQVDQGGLATDRAFVELTVDSTSGLEHRLRRLAGTVDGVVLRTSGVHSAIGELGTVILPALIAEGVVTPPDPGQSLREQLGLARPANRYATSHTISTGERS